MKLKLILFILLSFNLLQASMLYQHKIEQIIPFGINIENDDCSKVEMFLPIYLEYKSKGIKIYGDKNNFLIDCDKKNKISKINFYKNTYFTPFKLNKNMKFSDLISSLKSHFRPHLIKVTNGFKYKIVEVFINEKLYNFFVYNIKKEKIEFMSLMNMSNFPEYKYIGKLKNKKVIPPLISWLFL